MLDLHSRATVKVRIGVFAQYLENGYQGIKQNNIYKQYKKNQNIAVIYIPVASMWKNTCYSIRTCNTQ